MKDEYILIEDAMDRTGLSAKQLLNKSLNGYFTFYFYSSSRWRPVPVKYIEEMYYGRLNVQYSYRQLLDDERDELQLDMLHMRRKDTELLSFENGILTLPDDHKFLPKGLKIAVECWVALYGLVEDKDEAKAIKKKHIHEWIVSKYPPPEITNSFREEIAKVMNPFPLGGPGKKG